MSQQTIPTHFAGMRIASDFPVNTRTFSGLFLAPGAALVAADVDLGFCASYIRAVKAFADHGLAQRNSAGGR
jgi:hypothetical protein